MKQPDDSIWIRALRKGNVTPKSYEVECNGQTYRRHAIYDIVYCILRWKLTLHDSLFENNATKQFVSLSGNPTSCIWLFHQSSTTRARLFPVRTPHAPTPV